MLRHARTKWRSYVSAPLIPLLAVLGMTLVLAVIGWTMRLGFFAGLAGLAWPLMLAAGFAMTLLLLGLLVGWPLMWATIAVEGTDNKAEMGDLARALAVFKENALEVDRLAQERAAQEERAREEKRQSMLALADTFESSVQGVVNQVSGASDGLQASAQSKAGNTEQTTGQASIVANASELAFSNVQSVAAATEEVSASITEISQQVAQSTAIASQAVTEAKQTDQTINGLAHWASQRIGDVANLIRDIANQTNLLALNATWGILKS